MFKLVYLWIFQDFVDLWHMINYKLELQMLNKVKRLLIHHFIQ